MMMNSDISSLIEKTRQWHIDRNLINGSTDSHQFIKLMEETGELAANIARGKAIIDDVGDILVVLINICERRGITLGECLEHAYNDIKDRQGTMINGVFVKNEKP